MKQAEDYARNHGLYVFPTKPDKSPATQHGFKDATDQADRVSNLFSGKDSLGVAVWPGPSGYVVVDIDVKGTAQGDEEWHDLVREHGLKINTPTVITPSGGTHLWFKKPKGMTFDNTKLSDSIDIRGDGGYVVVPPTKGYEWEVSYPEVCKVCSAQHHNLDKAQEFPAELIQVLKQEKAKPAEKRTGPIPEGARQSTLFSIGMALRARGCEREEVDTALRAVNKNRCTPPLSEYRIRELVKGVMRSNMDADLTTIGRRIRHSDTGTVDWEELFQKQHAEVDWVPEMEGIAITGRATNIYGPAGTGKSELVLNRAAKAAKQGVSVLWLDREMTDIDVKDRLKEMGFSPADLDNLHYILYPDLPLLDTPDGGSALLALADAHNADVVVIDSLSKFVRDEEGESHTHYYIHTMLPMRMAGHSFVMIDHAGKDLSRKARGASQKVDNVDYYTEITRQAGIGAKLDTKKQRHSWVKSDYTYRRFTTPFLDYRLSQPMCSFNCGKVATKRGGPARRWVCDDCST